MAIEFDIARWAKVKEDARCWWAGELERPLIQCRLWGAASRRPTPRLPKVSMDTTAYDLSVSVEDILDRWDYELSATLYLGDAFPHVFADFGPGVIAAFLGAQPVPGRETVWFHLARAQEITEIQLRDDPDNVWCRRIMELSRGAVERWQGQVQVGMTDLGGNLDILATFRPGENLLLDLYDHPDAVKRLTWESHALWWRYFDRINAVLQARNPGYTAWAPIFSTQPYYILQCDFCYMISPAMFDEFVKPELAASCRRLGNAFYHLDGPGQLPHLDSLLEIKELKGIQWVPGAGQPGYAEWPEVYRKIRRAGKLIQTWGNAATLAALVDQLGSAAGIVMFTGGNIEQEPELRGFLQKYGAM